MSQITHVALQSYDEAIRQGLVLEDDLDTNVRLFVRDLQNKRDASPVNEKRRSKRKTT